ncbi:hypothetical protein OOU_Y34scaffold00135g1 [Pyricularia oryzae Y34]|uniref:Uncharacterized protein n=2 Tax=Pyricularia oryzae TaxID=318829 RepID=A0AA97PR15_PYRO3|nr:hypothetical protein OOU_Y34scaffold00135g1 [Pyricularia oryzae Y34]
MNTHSNYSSGSGGVDTNIYSPILADKQLDEEGLRSKEATYASDTHRRPRLWSITCVSSFLMGAIVAASILVTLAAMDVGTTAVQLLRGPKQVVCHCGVTAADGMAQGCVFDELELGWMRPECVDSELTREFSRAGPREDGGWHYETEIDGVVTAVNVSTLSTRVEPGRVIRFTYEQHVQHCIFEWRKQHRAAFLGTTLSLRRNYEDHIKHCGKMLLMKAGINETRTRLVYPSQIAG